MNKVKPTPGRWTATKLGTGVVAIKLGEDKPFLFMNGPADENLPDALLIAAAPDLLAAARELLALIDDVPIDHKLGDETDRVFPRYEFEPLRAAIAKAEGRS